MAPPRWSVRMAALLFLLSSPLVSGSADAGYCQNFDGGCTTACPAASSCFQDQDCSPGGRCIYDDSVCPSGSCFCQPLVPGQWYWACTLICVGICSNDMPDTDHDQVPDRFDDCPWTSNPGQRDTDRDGDGDACDCAPNDSTVYRPHEIADVRADRLPLGTRFHWSPTPPADSYEIQYNSLGVAGPGICWIQGDADPHDTEYVEPDDPGPGEGWWYLFRGVKGACGGPWGAGGYAPSCP